MVAINTKYTIEPHVNGGNAILADNKVVFNDMLGSSLGTVENGEFSEIRRTSFGDQLSNSSTSELSNCSADFFTGKPNVEGLGYAFLFRNYRADVGKWQTSDPLGYPDGWNNLAYVNNSVTDCFDWLGAWVKGVFDVNKETFSIKEGNVTVTTKAISGTDGGDGSGNPANEWKEDGGGPLPRGEWAIIHSPEENRWQLWRIGDGKFDDTATNQKTGDTRKELRLVVNVISHGCISMSPDDENTEDVLNMLNNTSYRMVRGYNGKKYRCYGVILVRGKDWGPE
jgi:RHS repeat-associated protein